MFAGTCSILCILGGVNNVGGATRSSGRGEGGAKRCGRCMTSVFEWKLATVIARGRGQASRTVFVRVERLVALVLMDEVGRLGVIV